MSLSNSVRIIVFLRIVIENDFMFQICKFRLKNFDLLSNVFRYYSSCRLKEKLIFIYRKFPVLCAYFSLNFFRWIIAYTLLTRYKNLLNIYSQIDTYILETFESMLTLSYWCCPLSVYRLY